MLRHSLLDRDQQYRDASEKVSLHHVELDKWHEQADHLNSQIANLESQLAAARDAEIQLEVQKQENLLLKETIDRMKFDMEELRHKADGNIPTSSIPSSNQNSLSKSLGEEILRMNNGKWIDEESDDEETENTAVEEEEEGDDTEGEDVIQTIITRKKKVCKLCAPSLSLTHPAYCSFDE